MPEFSSLRFTLIPLFMTTVTFVHTNWAVPVYVGLPFARNDNIPLKILRYLIGLLDLGFITLHRSDHLVFIELHRSETIVL